MRLLINQYKEVSGCAHGSQCCTTFTGTLSTPSYLMVQGTYLQEVWRVKTTMISISFGGKYPT